MPSTRTQRNAAEPVVPQPKQQSSQKKPSRAQKGKPEPPKAEPAPNGNRIGNKASQLAVPALAVSERYHLRQRKQPVGAYSQQRLSGSRVPSRKDNPKQHKELLAAQPVTKIVAETLSGTKAEIVNAWTHSVAELDKRSSVAPSDSSSSSVSSSSTSPAEREAIRGYYRRLGYRSPDEDMDSVQASSTHPSEGCSQKNGKERKKKIGSDRANYSGLLRKRKVSLEQSPDPDRKLVKWLCREADGAVTDADEEERWETDLTKCENAHEAVFQRTVMMDIINRYTLDENLDYIVEGPWMCAEPPRESQTWSVNMKAPMPDLAVAFKLESVIEKEMDDVDLGDLQIRLCPEGDTNFNYKRAFHFLSIEVKGVKAGLGNMALSFENLNTASQALYNIWLFFCKANKEQLFFKHIRVFSVSATTAGFAIRIHRAEKIETPRPWRMAQLAYKFENLLKVDNSRYSKAEMVNIVNNILDHAVKVLLPKLKWVVQEALCQLDAEKTAALQPPQSMGPPHAATTERHAQNSFHSTTTENDATTSAQTSFSAASQASSNRSKKRRTAAETASQERSKKHLARMQIQDSQDGE